MAVGFGEQIHALSGFDGDSASASEIGENFDDVTAEWMNSAIREVINQLPLKLKEKCMTATGVGTDFKVDLDGLGEILYVTRKNADSGYPTECRKIPSRHGGLSTDSTNMFHYATATDPVYWVDGDNSGAATLYVKPTPTADQTAILHHIGYPVFDADGSGTNINIKTAISIPNFPDEAEYLVVLRAAITATEYMMLFEEDAEVYAPQLQTLKQDYQQGIAALRGGMAAPGAGGRQ